jgi:uncharacterized small protein (DUF1192 family)
VFKEGKNWIPVEIANLAVTELEKRIATLEAQNAALTSQVQRLRWAGDAMAERMEDDGETHPESDGWWDAKNGGISK